MTNNNENEMNTEGRESLLRYTGEASDLPPKSPVSAPETLSETTTNTQPAPQFESRRARRMSETGVMPQVTSTRKNDLENLPVKEQRVEVIPYSAPPTQTEARVPAPVLSSLSSAVKKPWKPSQPFAKDYWGGTVLLTSLAVFLVAQVIFAVILVVYIALNYNLLTSFQSKNISIEQIMNDTPWLLVASMVIMYAAWLGCMWWVSKYRSGVQKGKKYWGAFKENFRLDTFKKRDIGYGVIIAVVMLGLQYLILNVIPELVPSLKPVLQASDNTGTFKNLNGFWFYFIAFGLGGIIGPICEELFFRGFLLRGFENHFSYKNSGRNMDTVEDELGAQSSTIKSMIVSYRHFTHKNRYIIATILTTILFGLAHYGGSWVTCGLTGLLGLVFAIVTLKTNRLYPSMVAHIVHNSAVFLVLALSK